MNQPRKLIIHHTGGVGHNPKLSTQHHTAEMIDAWHATRWPGFTSKVFLNKGNKPFHCGYHYIIEEDGAIVQCRAHSEEGAHTRGMNTSSIGICITGNFDVGVDTPSDAQKRSLRRLLASIQEQHPNLSAHDIEPHRRYATKSCWGDSLSDTYWRDVVLEQMGPSDAGKETARRKDNRVVLLTRLKELLEQYASLLLSLRKRQSSRE